MNEIDFDELDKAVNSIMNKGQNSSDDSKPTDSSDENTVSPAPTTTIADAPEPAAYNTVEPESKSVDEPKPDTTQESVADKVDEKDTEPSKPATVPHRLGRFMDVKHDSSKMREPALSVSRQGATIEPTSSNDISVEQEVSENLDDNSKAEPSADEATEVKDEASSKSADFTVSPFLTDAKVEKRPLGRPQKDLPKDDESSAEDAMDAAGKSDDTPEPADTMETPSSEMDNDEPVGMPEELQPDLVNIESGDDTKASDTPAEEVAEDKKPDEPKVDLASELSEDKEPSQEPDAKPAGPVSIPQQYKETPSSQPQDTGTIYDTENYHQPITHPAKKSSGWMIVVWIVLIILLGAALGAAAYMSGMI